MHYIALGFFRFVTIGISLVAALIVLDCVTDGGKEIKRLWRIPLALLFFYLLGRFFK